MIRRLSPARVAAIRSTHLALEVVAKPTAGEINTGFVLVRGKADLMRGALPEIMRAQAKYAEQMGLKSITRRTSQGLAFFAVPKDFPSLGRSDFKAARLSVAV